MCKVGFYSVHFVIPVCLTIEYTSRSVIPVYSVPLYAMVAGISHDIVFGMWDVRTDHMMWNAFCPYGMLLDHVVCPNHRKLQYRIFKGQK